MTVQDIQGLVEEWAHPSVAWERDNIGLQVGDPSSKVTGILVALDPTESIAAEAIRRGDNLIITHHPLLFKPARSISMNDPTGRIIRNLLGANVSLLAAHTNLDFTRGGTSFALGDILGLSDVTFLHRPYKNQAKIVTFIPAKFVDEVANAMAVAGAGHIGSYDHCSFRTTGTGTFRGSKKSHPAIGKAGERESVTEIRVEMAVSSRDIPTVVAALKRTHPYEQVAYDIYTTETVDPDHGMGIIGNLSKPTTLKRFIATVKDALNLPSVRYTGNPATTIRRVAACGGSGSDLLPEAVRQGADLFITADVKYHSFHDAMGAIALLDAGHYETEYPVVRAVVSRLSQELRKRKQKMPVHAASTSTNPIQYV